MENFMKKSSCLPKSPKNNLCKGTVNEKNSCSSNNFPTPCITFLYVSYFTEILIVFLERGNLGVSR